MKENKEIKTEKKENVSIFDERDDANIDYEKFNQPLSFNKSRKNRTARTVFLNGRIKPSPQLKKISHNCNFISVKDWLKDKNRDKKASLSPSKTD